MSHWGPKLAAALHILRKDGCRLNLKKVLYGDKTYECFVERIGRKAKLFGEKLKVEGAPTQCSPQEENGSKKRENQPQSTRNGAKEKREGVEGAPPQCSPQEENGSKMREIQPQSTPHKGNGAKENREGVEGAPPQCSPQEENGSKKRETQPQSTPHKGNGAKENRQGAQGGALLSNLSAIAVGQTVVDIAMKGVGQAISVHDKTLEEAAKTVWDSMTGLDVAKLISTANSTAQVTEMTHVEVKQLTETLDEARKELIEVKNDLRKELMEVKNDLREARIDLKEVKNDVREVKVLVGPPKPPSSGGGSGGGDDDDGDGNGWD